MRYDNFTTYAISRFTKRHCIRFTEMAYVIVAVFDSGKPCFISKKRLYCSVVTQECLEGRKLQAEWKIGEFAGTEPKNNTVSLDIIKRRVERAGFEDVAIQGDRVVGTLPSDGVVAAHIAKTQGWEIAGDQVFAA